MPRDKREALEQEEELFTYMKQSQMSEKNIGRLTTVAASENPRIAELAGIVLEVTKLNPYMKRRLKALARERRDLLEALDRTGRILAHHW